MAYFRFGWIVIMSVILPARAAWAEDFAFKNSGSQASLVELFSSEGCSSCPPAEAWVGGLKSDPTLWTQLFPVAFHVDYWDGLGWPDRFARPACTQRQRNYAAQLGQDSVYTPEMVLNGREWRAWSGGRPATTPTRGELSLTGHADGKAVSVRYAPRTPGDKSPYLINVAVLGVGIVSHVERGENSGRKLEQNFVVLDFKSTLLKKNKDGTFSTPPFDLKSVTADRPGALVGWISTPGEAITQVAGGWLPKSL